MLASRMRDWRLWMADARAALGGFGIASEVDS